MNRIKIGDKVLIKGNSRIHHSLLVPSIAEVIGMDAVSFNVFGHDINGRTYSQWISPIDIELVRKAVIV